MSIEELCDKYKIRNYTINDDGSIDVNESVFLNGINQAGSANPDGLTHIPLKFNKVDGHFDCSHNIINTLEGAPKYVTGNFYCESNSLISLEGSPERIDGAFDCSNNGLKSLKGSPKYVTGDFNCSNNGLKTLEESNLIETKSFDCSYNILTDLKGSPKKVGYFSCGYNYLTTLEGCPKIIKGHFDASYNELTSLKFGPESVNGYFSCNNNYMKNFEYIPKYIKNSLSLKHNQIDDLKGLEEVDKNQMIYMNGNPISLIFNDSEKYSNMEPFKIFKVINGSEINIKRFKYVLTSIFDYDLQKVSNYMDQVENYYTFI